MHERRADIEGLRAVAVLLVVLFHASIGGLNGGFVGVDVFFVISGFLITGLLIRERVATGTISLATFYARRARRLLPAAALVLLVTLILSVIFLPALLVPDVATDTASAALYMSNIGFAVRATDYFAAGQAPSPILHFWSLGVEEQFYLLWPALVLVVARAGSRPIRRVGFAVGAIAAGSFAISTWLTGVAEPWAFFTLPARAWELALGGCVAIASQRLRQVPDLGLAIAGWLGLGLIATAGLAMSESTPFPGFAALVPTVGAALVIGGGLRQVPWGPGRLLGSALPRAVGRISYSLYLWHWPLLVIPAVAAGAPLPFAARAGLVGAAVVLASATQRLVEDPFRRGRLVGTVPRRNLAMAGSLAVVVALVSAGVNASASQGLGAGRAAGDPVANAGRLDDLLAQLAGSAPGTGSTQAAGLAPVAIPRPSAIPTRPPTLDEPVPADLQPSLGDARSDYPEPYRDGCHTGQESAPSQKPCVYGDPQSTTTIALFGDSHALAWFPAVADFGGRSGWRVLDVTMSACSPADITIWDERYDRVSTACTAWRAFAMERLAREHPAIVLVTGSRTFGAADAAGGTLQGDARTNAWKAGMARTLDRLAQIARRVIVIADTPRSSVDPPVCLSQHPGSILACATPAAAAIDADWLALERSMAADHGAGFIDPTTWVCPSDPCPAVLGNLLVYRDVGHMTATFAAALADRLAQAVMADLPVGLPGPAR